MSRQVSSFGCFVFDFAETGRDDFPGKYAIPPCRDENAVIVQVRLDKNSSRLTGWSYKQTFCYPSKALLTWQTWLARLI